MNLPIHSSLVAIHRRRIVALALIVGLLGGCQPNDKHVRLDYTMPIGAGPRFDGRGQAVVIVPFFDQRQDRRELGLISSGAVIPTARLTADNDVGQWMTDAIGSELAHDNFAATSGPANTVPAGAFVVQGSVLKAYVKSELNYTAEVSFDVHVTRDGKDVLTKTYSADANQGINVAASPSMMARSLNDALRKCVEQFTRDFEASAR